MDGPPSYEEAAQSRMNDDRQLQHQQVTLTLVVPDEETDQHTISQTHEQTAHSTSVELPPLPPDEAPPPYDPLAKDLPSSPPAYDAEFQQSLEQKLIRVGLLSDRDFYQDNRLGGELVFVMAFIIAFLFNWIGFLFAYCLSISMAGRYGALSGFGASMVKWSIIAMFSDCCTPYMRSAACLMVALIFCGVLIFFRGIFLYMKAKASHQRGENSNVRFVFLQSD